MSKAILGAVELAGAVGLGVAAFFDPALIASPWFDKALAGLVLSGIANEAGAIAETLSSNRSMQVATRQPAAPRQIVYGTQMVGGVLVYESFTGHQWNQVILLDGHVSHSIQAIFLDGRKVFFKGSGFGWAVRNGVGFGGDADNNDHIGPDGVTKYNFGGKVYVEARYGDQPSGDVMGSLTGNDPSWAYNPVTGDAPSLMGCTYIYLKLTQSTSQFPSRPEVKILLNGKSDILDPRTGVRGFTNNAALIAADVITDTVFGLGDANVNQEQLVAAANICDEQVAVAALNGSTESRYCCDWIYDTSTPIADVLQTMMTGMAGRLSYTGGEYFIYPGAYVGPSSSLDLSAITAAFDWKPYRSIRELPNRVTATHISPEWPWSTAGNFYQNTQQVENTFDLKFTNSSVPYYAQDQLHGYPNDEWMTQDLGRERPLQMNLPTVLSLTQCQRVMKINLMRQRKYQGGGTIELKLGAYKVQSCDTLQFTFAQLGWSNQVMEIAGTTLRADSDGSGKDAPAIRYSMTLQETGPDVYSWSTLEELTVYSSPAAPTQTPWTPNPPTNLQLSSGPQTAIVGQDGSVTPVIQVNWDTPLDNAATGILIQFRPSGAGTWYSAPTADISLNVGLISTIIAGQNYDVRIATLRANGATSDWVEQDNFPVPSLDTFLGTLGSQLPAITGWLGKWWRLPNGGTPPAGGGELAQDTLFKTTGSIVDFILDYPGNSYQFARGTKLPPPPDGGTAQWIYGRFTCTFIAQQTGTYTFGVNSDDGARMTVDNQVLFDFLSNGHSGDPDLTYSASGTINLVAGGSYQIVIEFQNGSGPGEIQGLFTPPGASTPRLIDLSTTYRDAGSVTFPNGDNAQGLQPNMYSGLSGNLVPNGDFLLGSLAGWLSIGVFDPGIPGLKITGGQYGFSPTFAVQPGNKYRFSFTGQVIADGTRVIYHRLAFGSAYQPVLDPNVVGYVDFLAGGNINNGVTTYSYDWTCPGGIHYAGLDVYQLGTAVVGYSHIVAQDYAAAGQWGADVTGQNTANDTSFVSGVPSGVIATVVPTGYRLFINSGSKSYSIEAI
jgi:hypothetical protein